MFGHKPSSRLASSADSAPDIELPVLEAEHESTLALQGHELPSTSGSQPVANGRVVAQAQNREGGSDGCLPKSFRFFVHNWERFLLVTVLLVLVILISVKGITVFGEILNFFHNQNNWLGWLCFLGLYCVNVALFLPGIVLILGAGFVFGFPKGFLAVWLGGGVGQSFAFLLARYLVQDSVSVLVKGKWRQWELVDKAIEQEGWKLLVLLRLSPIVPYNLLNITMAATKIHFWPFAVASFFGIIPECSLLCYMGSLAENITQVVSGDAAAPKGATTYILVAVTLVLLIGSATCATLFVRRALRRAEAQLRGDSEGDLEVGTSEDAGTRPAPASGGLRGQVLRRHAQSPGFPS